MINKAEVVVRGVQEYINKAKQKPFIKPIKLQMKEIYGVRPLNKGNYHTLHYENLIKNIMKTREEFRATINVIERKKIAQNELKLWNDYVDIRKKELPEEFRITNAMIGHMEEVWSSIKTRGEDKLSATKILDFHYEYAKSFKFEVPIDARYLVQMVHPSMGYLSYISSPLAFQELLDIYDIKLVASYEKSLGQTLLGNEISSLAYWNYADKKREGCLSLKNFIDFIKMFRITLKVDKTEFLKEFNFGLQFHKGEFSKDISELEDIVRFDFFRYIFLERNL